MEPSPLEIVQNMDLGTTQIIICELFDLLFSN